VLKIQKLRYGALILADHNLATASIDSSDGLAKSLRDLMISNPRIGFEIVFNETLIDKEAMIYSNEFDISLENLIFDGGEEFIHIFTIPPENYSIATSLMQEQGGNLYLIGKVISENKIYVVKEENKYELNSYGFEHFK
jgi:thiamine monophosphate kinase